MQLSPLEIEFHAALLDLCERVKDDCKLPLTRFRKMIAQHPGADSARILMRKGANLSVVAELFSVGKSCLTVEHLILQPEWRSLFDDAQRAEAEKRLKQPPPKIASKKVSVRRKRSI